MAPTVVYREYRWNLVMAAYMGLRGLVILGLAPAIVLYLVGGEALWVKVAVTIVLSTAAAVPLVRSLTGQVWVQDEVICSRNAFRTVRCPLGSVRSVTTRYLWQRFFSVAVLEVDRGAARRRIPLVPVPGIDADLLADRLGLARR